ncbi:Vgb family protein [Flavobacterium notoginsengisoli]|uniref:Vgb family protein n=1 Tax=Flavobacterium notoginsengisoli TaxID=1478199 RepID=UPI00363CCCCF
MSTDYNRIKVADLETNQPDKILITNNNGELEFNSIENIKIDNYNGLDYTQEGKALDARQGKILKDLIDNLPPPPALDNVLHKTGFNTETKSGELVIDSGTAGTSGLKLNKISTSPSITTTSFTNGLNNPSSICDGGDGYYYVANNGNSTISKIDKTTGELVNASFSTTITSPFGICKANDGNLYVTSSSNGTIYKLTLTGVVSTFVTGLSNLNNLTQGKDGNLYVVSQLGTVYKITLAGAISNLVTGLNNPRGIVQGIDNNLYVTISHNIYKITLSGVSTLFATFSGIDGAICQASNGDFYTVSYGGYWIVKITSSGVSSIHKTVSPFPKGILIGSDNYLYSTTDSGDKIEKTNIISNDKVLKTDSTGQIVKTTYLEDVPYLKASDTDVSNLVTKNNIKTINGESILGNGNIDFSHNQDISDQIEVSSSQTIPSNWHGKTVLFTTNCTITVPSSLPQSFIFNGITLPGVTVIWLITAPHIWLFGTPSATTEKQIFTFTKRGNTNSILLLGV